ELLHIQPDQAHAYLVRARTIVKESLMETRRTVQGLRAQELEQHNLADALSHLAQQTTQDSGIPVLLQVEGRVSALPVQVEGELFRIGQEAVTNALRHAHPQQIT